MRVLGWSFLVCFACSKPEPAPATAPTGRDTPPVAPPVDATAARVDAAGAIAGPAAPPPAEREDQSVATVGILGGGPDDGGDLDKRPPGSDLAQQIEALRNSGKDVSLGGRGHRAGSGSATTTGPTGRITISDKRAFDNTTLTVDVVLAKVMAAYMAGVKRCYRQMLAIDPSARGKMKLAFTVNEAGRVVSPKATGFDAQLDECIAGHTRAWRFAVPKDADGEPTEASFDLVMLMIPD